MRNDHVAERASLLVKSCATSQSNCFRHINLDMVDEIPIPYRLKQTIGEPECQYVLRGLLTQKK